MTARTSLVQSTYQPSGPVPSRCGYCKSEGTFLTEAVWGFRMTCQDYQDLVDRGFQRSGKFVYRPRMKETCCPQYVIRTDVTKFKPSKSQRYAIRKFRHFLQEGQQEGTSMKGKSILKGSCNRDQSPMQLPSQTDSTSTSVAAANVAPMKKKKQVKPGLGPDPNKPPPRKAKEIRKEKRQKKALSKCATPVSMLSSRGSPSVDHLDYPLDELISVPTSQEDRHKLECRLVPATSQNQTYRDTVDESFQLFVKFQQTIHKEKEEDCTYAHFREFLEQSPLIPSEGTEGMPCGYGTYHQQYLIDGKMIAVGVLDILPRGVLCEYLYYDPAYRFLAPGVYSAINEIWLTQQCYRVNPAMQYYYMGFYVQSCPKMNYKSQYSASSLLCPETHTYVSLMVCIPKLISSGYSRLADVSVPNVKESFTDEELDSLPVFSLMHASEQPMYKNMTYREFKSLYGVAGQPVMEEYVRIVGLDVASRMTIYLAS